MDAINRAEKKIRQAEFFLAQLTALRVPGHTREVKEFLLSACSTAAQSAFYVLHSDGGDLFNREHKRWRQQTRTQEERAFLKWIDQFEILLRTRNRFPQAKLRQQAQEQVEAARLVKKNAGIPGIWLKHPGAVADP